ncbi:uncharacterized protein BROUX77_001306 [Berkeleyomyces rouxiae]|uniref:uncharacterized protein n=1 Tax=Berkeleyomyces rouxiae TaxID=2035830 RepID=UPI003B7B329E
MGDSNDSPGRSCDRRSHESLTSYPDDRKSLAELPMPVGNAKLNPNSQQSAPFQPSPGQSLNAKIEFTTVTRNFEASADSLFWVDDLNNYAVADHKPAVDYETTNGYQDYERIENSPSPVAIHVRKSEDSTGSRNPKHSLGFANLPDRDGIFIADFDALVTCDTGPSEKTAYGSATMHFPELPVSRRTSQSSSSARNARESYGISLSGSHSQNLAAKRHHGQFVSVASEASLITNNDSVRSRSSVRSRTSSTVPDPPYIFALNAARALEEAATEKAKRKRLLQAHTTPVLTPTKRYCRLDQIQQKADRWSNMQQRLLQSRTGSSSFDNTERRSFGNGQPRVDSNTLPFCPAKQRTIPVGSTFGSHMEIVSEEGENDREQVFPQPRLSVLNLPYDITRDLESALDEALDREEREYKSTHNTWKPYDFREIEVNERLAASRKSWENELSLISGPSQMRSSYATNLTFGPGHLSTDSDILNEAMNTALPNETPYNSEDEQPHFFLRNLESTAHGLEPIILVNRTPSQFVTSRKRSHRLNRYSARRSLILGHSKSRHEVRSSSLPLAQLKIQIPDRTLVSREALTTPLHTGVSSAFDVSPPQKTWRQKAQGLGSRLKQRLSRKSSIVSSVTRMQSVPILATPKQVPCDDTPQKMREGASDQRAQPAQGSPAAQHGGISTLSERLSFNNSMDMCSVAVPDGVLTDQLNAMDISMDRCPVPGTIEVIATTGDDETNNETPRRATPMCDRLAWGLPPVLLLPNELEPLNVAAVNNMAAADDSAGAQIQAQAQEQGQEQEQAQAQAQEDFPSLSLAEEAYNQSIQTSVQEPPLATTKDQDQGHDAPQLPSTQQCLQLPGLCEKPDTPTPFLARTSTMSSRRLRRLPFLRHRHITGVVRAGDAEASTAARVSGEPAADTSWLRKVRDAGWLHRT